MTTFTQSSRTEEAIEVPQLTNDGDDLGPQDLSLLQSAVNGHLTETASVPSTNSTSVAEPVHTSVHSYSAWSR
jgi:hypothetical protein